MHADFKISSFAFVGFHSILTVSFKRFVYFVMYLISMPQDSVCVWAHAVCACGSMLENGAFSLKSDMCADPLIYYLI